MRKKLISRHFLLISTTLFFLTNGYCDKLDLSPFDDNNSNRKIERPRGSTNMRLANLVVKVSKHYEGNYLIVECVDCQNKENRVLYCKKIKFDNTKNDIQISCNLPTRRIIKIYIINNKIQQIKLSKIHKTKIIKNLSIKIP